MRKKSREFVLPKPRRRRADFMSMAEIGRTAAKTEFAVEAGDSVVIRAGRELGSGARWLEALAEADGWWLSRRGRRGMASCQQSKR